MATSADPELKCIDLTAQDDDDDIDVLEIEDGEEQGDDSEEEACCICQDAVALVTQGFLPSCDHRFHFDCIVTWSKITNLCPLCKLKFNTVVRRDEHGAVTHSESIVDTKQVFRPDPNDHDVTAQLRLVNNVRCEGCGRGDDEHVLLMCEAPLCMNASHTYCVGLTEVPSHAWYCSVHHGGPARASDLIERPASTVSSRRRTRRLATLMTNVINGAGAIRQRGSAASSGASRGRRVRRRGRLTLPDGEGLDLGAGRPIRGVALSYALHMSRELQAIQHRADTMFARGDLGASALYAPPRGSILGSRSTSNRSATDIMWEDRAQSQRQIAEAMRYREEVQYGASLRLNTSRLSSAFGSEYRDLAKRMADAASHDNYASTVSLTIPKTARLRLVSAVKSFFGKLNEREKLAALDAGCLGLLFSWVRAGDNGGATVGCASADLHPQVLEAVLLVLESLPVRIEDLKEVKAFQERLDEISNQDSVAMDFRERCIVLSETWREIDPPPRSSPPDTEEAPTSRPQSSISSPSEAQTSLPAIHSFANTAPQADRANSKRKLVKRKHENHPVATQPVKKPPETWSSVAVEYVKAKLYPLYKDSKGVMSKDDFKTVVKQVVARFRVDAAAMQSPITKDDGNQLTNISKKRLMQLLDQVYRESQSSSTAGRPTTFSTVQTSNMNYSATPNSVKRPRTS